MLVSGGYFGLHFWPWIHTPSSLQFTMCVSMLEKTVWKPFCVVVCAARAVSAEKSSFLCFILGSWTMWGRKCHFCSASSICHHREIFLLCMLSKTFTVGYQLCSLNSGIKEKRDIWIYELLQPYTILHDSVQGKYFIEIKKRLVRLYLFWLLAMLTVLRSCAMTLGIIKLIKLWC